MHSRGLCALPGAAFSGLVLLALAGCTNLLHSDAKVTQVYVLRAAGARQGQVAPRPARVSIHVIRPVAGPGLDSDHIVLMQSDHRMSYYVASRWPTVLPEVVESLAVQTLRATGAWSGVQDSSSAFSSDYMLQIVIRRFEADYTTNPGAPEVHVVLDCTVARSAGREVLTSFVAEGSAVASANRLGEVVSAFEDASNKALVSIADGAAQAAQGAPEK
jgi:ABC-type uncharacterized transport system auxiliary subunit